MEYYKPVENVWLTDDDQDDREIFEDAIKEVMPGISLTVLSGGEELLALIDSGNLPDLLFLDITMPCSGFNCLNEIRRKRQLEHLPIIIFTSSIHPKDIDTSYNSGANLFFKKPSSFRQLVNGLARLIQMNWSDPSIITASHYINGRFVPYSVV